MIVCMYAHDKKTTHPPRFDHWFIFLCSSIISSALAYTYTRVPPDFWSSLLIEYNNWRFSGDGTRCSFRCSDAAVNEYHFMLGFLPARINSRASVTYHKSSSANKQINLPLMVSSHDAPSAMETTSVEKLTTNFRDRENSRRSI